MNIYVASSWRCPHQPRVVQLLRVQGHEVYDFRHPAPGNNGFAWSEIDIEWMSWTPKQFVRKLLGSSIAAAGFNCDWEALRNCDACLCVLPCGRSAHLELGYALGAAKRTAVYMPENTPGVYEPELMYLGLDSVLIEEPELLSWGAYLLTAPRRSTP
jgi:hypothetical protein